jgi:hypothetical protein
MRRKPPVASGAGLSAEKSSRIIGARSDGDIIESLQQAFIG